MSNDNGGIKDGVSTQMTRGCQSTTNSADFGAWVCDLPAHGRGTAHHDPAHGEWLSMLFIPPLGDDAFSPGVVRGIQGRYPEVGL